MTLTAARRRQYNDDGFALFLRAGAAADAGQHLEAADLFRDAATLFAEAAAGDDYDPGSPCLHCGCAAPGHDPGCALDPFTGAGDGPADPQANDPGYLRHLIVSEVEALRDGEFAYESRKDLLYAYAVRSETSLQIAEIIEAQGTAALLAELEAEDGLTAEQVKRAVGGGLRELRAAVQA